MDKLEYEKLRGSMSRFIGIFGIILIFGLAYLMSNNKKAINYKTVGFGFLLQVLLAVFIFKVPLGQKMFMAIGLFIQKLLVFAKQGDLCCTNLLFTLIVVR